MSTVDPRRLIGEQLRKLQPHWFLSHFERSRLFIGKTVWEWKILKTIRWKGLIYFLAKCKCGIVKRVRKASILHGTSKSCYRCSIGFIDVSVGKKFGDYTIEKLISKGDIRLLLKCKCGSLEKKSKAFLLHPQTTKTCHHKVAIIGKRFSRLLILSESV